MRGVASLIVSAMVLLTLVYAQNPPAAPLTLVSREGRRPVPTTIANGQELIALDDVASLFQVAVREDTLAGGITVTYRGRTIVLAADQPMASVNGRVVTLPAPPVRSGRRWLVPLEFLPRALAPLLETRVDLRRPSRLLIVGDVAVPRVTARIDAAGPPTRATLEIAPAAPVRVTREGNRVVARIDADALDIGLPGEGGGLVTGFRPGDQPTSIFVVLDDRAGNTRFTPADSGGVTRVAIEVAPAAATETAAAPPAPTPAPSEPAAPPLLNVSRSVLQTIAIDPGHGGADAGVHPSGGAEEKQITLQVARRLRTLIEMRLGVRVIHDARRRHVGEPRRPRGRREQQQSGPLSQSSPQRVSRDERRGRRSLSPPARPRRRRCTAGGRDGSRDAAGTRRSDAEHRRHSVGPGTGRATSINRRRFAAILEDALRGAKVTMAARPRQDAPLRLLTSVNMPAALIEMAYLTNAADRRLVRSEDYQNAMAQGIYDAVLRFRAYLEDQRPQ